MSKVERIAESENLMEIRGSGSRKLEIRKSRVREERVGERVEEKKKKGKNG